ncbi:restriction endonuclease subunit S [Phascolarctobacterium succinatutens]|uniref:restriction endonuclease subunit S n=1 Tax=Phascolarctobacterium succinatutens TaxID=626940 RepID=UPI003AAE285D
MKWEKKTLDELGTVGRGRSKHRPRNDPKLFGGKYPFIQTADVKNANFYIINFSSTYNEEGLAQSKLWPAGTLCITIAANIADTGILAIPACFPDSIMGFVANEEIADTRFVKYCFDVLQKECKQISQGTAQDNLSWEKLSTIKFLVPLLQTQKRIASILSAYDDLIENNQKQIKLLEEAAQRLYKEWFVDLRFPGHESVKIVDGVPEGWSSDQLIKLAEFKRGKTITKSSVKEGNVPVIAGGLEPAYFHNVANTVAPVITVSASGANAGYTALHNHNVWASDCSFIDSKICEHIYYVYNFLKTNKNMMLNLQKGSAQPHVYAKNINELILLIPEEKVLKEYSNKVEVIYKAIFHKSKQISSLREARDRLLPKLMSGEIEV